MLNAKAFANAASVVMGTWVIACTLLSYLFPNLLFSLAQPWMHNINLETVKTTFNPNVSSIILGFVSAVALTWITAYSTIWLYNRLSKGK